jgi:hypothetical protein
MIRPNLWLVPAPFLLASVEPVGIPRHPASSALQHDETQATATLNHAPARGSPVSTPDAWQQHQAPMPRAPSDHDQAPATPAGSVPRFRRTGWDYTPPASTSHPPSSVGEDVHLDIPSRPSALQQHQTQATATPNHVPICGPPVLTLTNPGNRSEFSDVTPATLSSRNGLLQEDIRGLYESYSSQTHEASKHHAELFASKTLEASKHHAELFTSTYSETLNMLVNEKKRETTAVLSAPHYGFTLCSPSRCIGPSRYW